MILLIFRKSWILKIVYLNFYLTILMIFIFFFVLYFEFLFLKIFIIKLRFYDFVIF